MGAHRAHTGAQKCTRERRLPWLTSVRVRFTSKAAFETCGVRKESESGDAFLLEFARHASPQAAATGTRGWGAGGAAGTRMQGVGGRMVAYTENLK